MSDQPRFPRAGVAKARSPTAKPRDKLNRLAKRPGVIVGDSRGLASVSTFNEAAWRKKWDKRLK